jgi:ribosomal protein S18
LCFSCNSQKHTNHVDYRDPQLLEEFLANLKD